MPTNWPPASAPAWPPPEVEAEWLSFSDVRTLAYQLWMEWGFTQEAPTKDEDNLYFKDTLCTHEHRVIGRMIVSPGEVRYPFAVCNNKDHRELLVLWPPYTAGTLSGLEE